MNYQKAIDIAFEEYNDKINDIAQIGFICVVKPYCQRNNYNFIAGNGVWYVFKNDEQKTTVDPDVLPQKVYSVLVTPVKGLPSNDLGSLMSDFYVDK